MKIERMLTIIVMLLNRKRVTANELAEKFEVSVRTIYRDIETINLAGIPIISHSGNNGGFSIYENYKLNHQVLTLNNLSSLLSILKDINTTVDDIELESSIEKLQNIVPENKLAELKLQSEQIIIDLHPYGDSPKQKELVKTIRQAITQTRLLTIDYRNYDSEVSTRQIEPMSLIFKNYTWYLFAYCQLKEDFRLFRVSRIKDCQLEGQTFERQETSYHEMTAQEFEQAEMITLVLKVAPNMKSRVEDIFNQEDIEILETGEFLITAMFPDKDWLFSLVFSFGEHVEVLEPKKLRESVANRLKLMADKYN
ncbi:MULTISPECIES: YafY family protein [Vagococcus]|uniref:Transcriptional regulator, DeoR family n=1 Tax=Vagococcus fluvialis bH819 TaxID=1255619 RepID=A0A1X6WR54_9ENTE|nr:MULTISPECIES: YafY family protein [Vagococcus]SLM86136.1 Transcriptional regulator, DeoR family [Vagococcus fluvialis bH819]HCM90384.1 YafY family transcriptional regulator [Vagococcus sp.]